MASKHRMGNGYQIAIDWYKEQKDMFMSKINQVIGQEEQLTGEQILLNMQQQPPDDVDIIVNNLVTEINNLINQDSSKTKIRNYLTNKYNRGEISKTETLNLLQKYISKFFTPEYIRTKILSKLGTVGGKQLSQIDDNALLGKIKMLLSMSLRHEILNPSEYTKKTVAGVLYEHAIVGGMQKYFNSIPQLEQIVKVEAIGAKGTRGDIKISLDPTLFTKEELGETKLFNSLEVQIKNYDIDTKLQTHANKITVGSSAELLSEFQNNKNYNFTKDDSIYFLSQANRVIRAIGRNVFLYGYANGQFKFTSDLIQQCRDANYCLAFTNLNKKDKTQQAYINWVRQKS